MLDYPWADKIYGVIRENNKDFECIMQLLPEKNNNNRLWCNEQYLRCLYYTAYHLTIGFKVRMTESCTSMRCWIL